MSDFSGFEPQIGEIRAVRTFRVGSGGRLFPLFSERPWVADSNEAACRLSLDATHLPPEPDCACGFYAYAGIRSAGEYPFARYVLAVVACWGRVIAGTQGIRAQYARIEAVWLSAQVPVELAAMVSDRYPSATIYADPEEMVSAHPVTALDCYVGEQYPRPRAHVRLGMRLGAAAALIVGLIPVEVISSLPLGWWAWSALVIAVAAAAIAPRRHRIDRSQSRHRLLSVALVLWLLAPLAGVAGMLFLRLPLLQIAILLAVHRSALDRLARTFPASI